MSYKLLGHVVAALWTGAWLGWDAHMWLVYPGWEVATQNALAMEQPTFLPVLFPLVLWALFTIATIGDSSASESTEEASA